MLALKRVLSTSTLLTSNVLANGILFFGVFVASRLVTPAELGIASAFLATVLAIYPAFTLRYELAIPVTRSDASARSLLAMCVLLSLGFAFVVSLTVVVAHESVESWLDPRSTALLPLVGPSAFALSIVATLQMAALRRGAILYLALSRVLRAVVIVIGQVALVLLLARNATSLVAADIIANLAAAGLLIISGRHLFPSSFSVEGLKRLGLRMWAAAKQHRVFATVSLPHAMIHQALMATYGILIGSFYGATAMGHYFLMRRMIFGATGLISVTVYQSCLSEASESKGDLGRLRTLWLFAVSVLGGLTIVPALALLFYGEVLFRIVFGEQWAVAGALGGAAFSLIVMETVTSALSFIPVFRAHQIHAFGWSMAQNIVGLLSLAATFHAGGSLYDAILWSSLLTSLVMLAFAVWLRTLCAAPSLSGPQAS